jgi:LPS-assembly lipoprotein
MNMPIENRISGSLHIDPSNLGITRGGKESSAKCIRHIDSRERRRQQSGKPKRDGYIFLRIFCLCILPFLVGCGFHLRTEYPLPSKLNSMYLKTPSPYSEFTLSLKEALKSNKIFLTENAKTAKSVLEIVTFDFKHSWANAYSSAQANVYTFFMTVEFRVVDSYGKDILSTQAVHVTRSLTLNPHEVLASSNQVETNKQEMEQEIIDKILRTLSSKQIYAHLS